MLTLRGGGSLGGKSDTYNIQPHSEADGKCARLAALVVMKGPTLTHVFVQDDAAITRR